MRAHALAAARPEQADHECYRQAEDDEAGNEGERAGGMFHVEERAFRQIMARVTADRLRRDAVYCTGQGLTLH
ncbi:hypothetical protein GCM10027065_01590 [Rhodanobacter koreensis]